MRIFKNTWFTRFAKKEGIKDTELYETVSQLEAGQADADLGGGVYKVRVARQGEGKSGGYRVIVFLRARNEHSLSMALQSLAKQILSVASYRF